MTKEEKARRVGLARLFGTGMLQVFLVASNTVFISQYHLLGNFLTALGISYVWTHNVKKIAFGGESDRWAYASGAAVGSILGSIAAHSLMG